MRQGDFITDYEVKLGAKIAEVLCGGKHYSRHSGERTIHPSTSNARAFKSLCGEKKTQERIQFTLKTGKTLRN